MKLQIASGARRRARRRSCSLLAVPCCSLLLAICASDISPAQIPGRDAPQSTSGPGETRKARETRNRSGGLLWEDRHNVGGFGQGFSVATWRDRAFVVGFVEHFGRRDAVVRAYDSATGHLAWQDERDGGGDDFVSGVVTDDNRVYVSGVVSNSSSGWDWVLRAYHPESGALLWENSFDLAGRNDAPRGTALAAADGLVFLGGYGTNAQDVGDFNTDYIVRAHDASSGGLVWEDRISGFSGAHTLVVEEHQLFVGGWSSAGADEFALVRAYNAAGGALLWEHRNPGAPGFGQNFTRDIAAHGGRVIAAQVMRATSPPFALAPVVQAYDARTGEPVWRDSFDTAGPSVWLESVEVSGGRAFAVGHGGAECGVGSSNCDTVIRSYRASSGRLEWERQLDLSGADDAATLVTEDRGMVFVFSEAEATFDIPTCCTVGRWVVQAFDSASGTLIWQTVGGNLESAVYNMVVDRARLFIPGRKVNAAREWDLLVRAYDVKGPTFEIQPLLVAPRVLAGTGSSGQLSFAVTAADTVTMSVHGAIPAQEQPATVIDDPTNDVNAAFATGIGISIHEVTVPPGTRFVRLSLFDDETDGADDLDMYVFAADGTFVNLSGAAGSNEHVDIEEPPPGQYFVVVHGYETDGPDANYTLFAWTLGDSDLGNMQLSGPEPLTGPVGTVTVRWFGLSEDRRYLGAIRYHDGPSEVGRTLITIRP